MQYVERKRLTKKDVKKMDLMQLIKAHQRVTDELNAIKTEDKEYLQGLYESKNV